MSERKKALRQWTAVQAAVSEAYKAAQLINGDAGHDAALLLRGVSGAVESWMRMDLADLEAMEG